MAELQVVHKDTEENDLLRNLDEDLNYALNYCFQEVNVQQGTSVMVSRNLPYAEQMWVQNDPLNAIQDLFIEYNLKYFYGLLQDVEVGCGEFQTGCVGSCSVQGPDDHCTIRLSWHLLKHRPHCDLEETLLHEMIHAYLFVTGIKEDRERHGPEFVENMTRINKEAGTSISIYHSLTDRPDLSRPHWWKCDGVCRKWSPFHGNVKRAIDRTPGSGDIWWTAHNRYCEGQFIKVKHPSSPEKRPSKRKHESENIDGSEQNIPKIFVKSTARKSMPLVQKYPKLPHSENTDVSEPNIPKIFVKSTARKSMSFVQKCPKLPNSVFKKSTDINGPSSSRSVEPVSHSPSSSSSPISHSVDSSLVCAGSVKSTLANEENLTETSAESFSLSSSSDISKLIICKHANGLRTVSIGSTHVSGPSSSGIVQPVSHSASSNSSEELNFVADSSPDCADV